MGELPQPTRWTPRLLVLAACACSALVGYRVWTVLYLRQPGLIITSGCEEESLFAIWKFANGQPVYSNPETIPYAVSYFNFLFYKSYGLWSEAWLTILGLSDSWLPTLARCLTLVVLLANVLVLRQIMKEADLIPANFGTAAAWSAALLPFINPMVGLWVFTARPDWLAILFELLGLLWLLRHQRQGGGARLVMACIFLYAAWATKQSSVAIVTAWCLLNLARRRWRDVGLVAGLLVTAFGLTCLLGNSAYRQSVFFSQRYMRLDLEQGVQYFVIACQEYPLLGLGILALGIWGWRFRARFRNAPMQLLSWCFLISLLWAFVAAMKSAANTNYFYLSGALSMLWLLALLRSAVIADARFDPGWWAACVLLIAAVVQLAVGRRAIEQTDFRIEQKKWMVLTARLTSLPGPQLVTVRAGNLPWIQPHAPYFVVGTTYPYDRQAGVIFERGGLGGLVAAGYFSVVAVSRDDPAATIDGTPLTSYRLENEDAYFRYYVRTDVHTGQ